MKEQTITAPVAAETITGPLAFWSTRTGGRATPVWAKPTTAATLSWSAQPTA